MTTGRVTIRDTGRRSDPETAAILRTALVAHDATKPVKPPAVLAYEAEVQRWKVERAHLASKLLMTTKKRYDVLKDVGFCMQVVNSFDTKTEAEACAKTERDGLARIA